MRSSTLAFALSAPTDPLDAGAPSCPGAALLCPVCTVLVRMDSSPRIVLQPRTLVAYHNLVELCFCCTVSLLLCFSTDNFVLHQ